MTYTQWTSRAMKHSGGWSWPLSLSAPWMGDQPRRRRIGTDTMGSGSKLVGQPSTCCCWLFVQRTVVTWTTIGSVEWNKQFDVLPYQHLVIITDDEHMTWHFKQFRTWDMEFVVFKSHCHFNCQHCISSYCHCHCHARSPYSLYSHIVSMRTNAWGQKTKICQMFVILLINSTVTFFFRISA